MCQTAAGGWFVRMIIDMIGFESTIKGEKQLKKLFFGIAIYFIGLSLSAQSQNVENILDTSGGIQAGAHGSFSTDGYEMTLGKNDEPVFHKAKRIQKTSSFTWSSLTAGGSNGVGGTVYAVAVKGTDVYVGGNFTTLGNGSTSANRIAKWNGSNWSTLPVGITNGVNNTVRAIAVSGNDVYVAGYFTRLGDGTTVVNHIAKWDGSSWSSLTSGGGINGVNGNVYSLAVNGSSVYVGGFFSTLGDNSTSAKNIALWNGSDWSLLPSGGSNGVNNTVFSIASSGSDVYFGGDFVMLGDGSSAKHIVKWNGSSWATLPSGASNGVNDAVNSIVANGSEVYLGGRFTVLGDNATNANYLAKWNGTVLTALTGSGINGVNNVVNAIALSGSDLYAGGNFTMLGNNSTTASYMSKWNGSAWSAVGNGTNSFVNALQVSTSEGKLYLGGDFTVMNGATNANYIGGFTDTDNPMPVELFSFTLSVCENSVLLKWSTVTELNNYGFEIQRSEVRDQRSGIDGHSDADSDSEWSEEEEEAEESRTWTKVAFVEGNGNSNDTHEYSYTDRFHTAGKYSYRLKQIDRDGKFEYSQKVEVTVDGVPTVFTLDQNYPNPFNPTTTIGFTLQVSGMTTLKVFDAIGREVASLVNENLESGVYHQRNFDASRLSSGVYVARLSGGNQTQMKKLVLMK